MGKRFCGKKWNIANTNKIDAFSKLPTDGNMFNINFITDATFVNISTNARIQFEAWNLKSLVKIFGK